MAELPSGTVTFLVDAHGGVHIRSRGEGDSRFAVLASAPAAVASALEIQRAFAAEPRPAVTGSCALRKRRACSTTSAMRACESFQG